MNQHNDNSHEIQSSVEKESKTESKIKIHKSGIIQRVPFNILVVIVVAIVGISILSMTHAISNTSTTSTQSPYVGFPRKMSWAHGQTARFSFSSGVTSAQIYQMGTNGLTGALVATIPVINTTQPACLQLKNGSTDCGDWSTNASWAIPATAPSTMYRAVPIASDGTQGNPVPFVVRCDQCASDIIVMTSDATWQAYNTYGGGSLYHGNNPLDPKKGREYRVSYNRPLVLDSGAAFNNSLPENAEYPMLNYLTANGFSYSYVSQLDVEANPSILLHHKIILTSGHLEYVSNTQRSAIQSAINAGESFFNATGNDFYWKIDPQPSIDATKDPYRTIVCYKETLNNADINPSAVWTGTWRDKRFSPPNDGGRPENTLTGQLYTIDMQTRNDSIQFTAQQARSPFLRNTTATTMQSGQVLTMPAGTLGYEWDEVVPDGETLPASELQLSTAVVSPIDELQPNSSGDYSQIKWSTTATATHHTTVYQAASGALVFSAGDIQWSWGLSNDHARFVTPTADPIMQQATMNMLIDMGALPTTPQSGLTVSPRQTFSAYTAITVSPANSVNSTKSSTTNFPSSQIQYAQPQPLSGEE